MARIKVEDREACFKRLRKRRLGGSKETDMGQKPEILESWRAHILKSVIIQVKKVTCESILDFIPMQLKIQSH